MKNVFCDICGSAYPESESNCPICGSSREYSLDGIGEDFLAEGLFENEAFLYDTQPEQRSRKKPKEIFDFDEVNQEPAREVEEPVFEDEEEYEERGGSNVALVVILLILIVLLLLTAGYLYLRFFLPNMKEEAVETSPVTTVATTPEETEVTEDPGIPCTDIVMDGGKIELGKDGKWLLNVQVYPANTTDTLSYASEDESIATVSDSGTITAVGEGQTMVVITCGTRQIKCSVLVDYSIQAETVSEGTIPGLEVDTDDSEETMEETEPADVNGDDAQETEATEPAELDEDTEVTLKLKTADITIFSNHTSIKLELEGDIALEDVEWYTVDSTVAICHDGIVTSTGSGITRIIGEYKGQQVECIIRCNF